MNCNKKNIKNSLSYNDIVKFTKISKCIYCDSNIIWYKHAKSTKASLPYNLDRKNSSLGYSKENCVVCCSICNKVKNNIFTHEEFLLIGKVIKKVLSERRR